MRLNTPAAKLFFNTVRINTTSADDTARMGTGFFYRHVKNGESHTFLVTSKRTTTRKYGGHLSLLLGENGRPKFRSVFRYAVPEWHDSWFNHPDPEVDITLLPFDRIERSIQEQYGAELFYTAINEEWLPTEEEIEMLDAIESVVFVGYSDGTCDTKNWLPVVRSAITATPIGADFEGRPNFLIDAQIFPGSCGSPIFVYNQGCFCTSDGVNKTGPRLLFVGSLSTGHLRQQPETVVTAEQLLWEQERTHLGFAFKARVIKETIEIYLQTHGKA